MSLIGDYLEKLSGPEKAELENIRALVHEVAPEAEEVITYGMPGFKYEGKYLVAFNVFKDHIGLFPASGPIEKLSDKLKGFKTSKGGIQFTAQHPLPDDLIKELLRARIAEITG